MSTFAERQRYSAEDIFWARAFDPAWSLPHDHADREALLVQADAMLRQARAERIGGGPSWCASRGRAHRIWRLIGGERHYECSSCERWLPQSEFYPLANPASRCGIKSWCKACENAAKVDRRRTKVA